MGLESPDYVILYVRDLEASIAFYRDVIRIPFKFQDAGYAEFATQATRFGLLEHSGLLDLIGRQATDGGPAGEVLFLVDDDVAQARLHRLAFVERQILGTEPGPTALAEQVARGRAPFQRALQDCVDLVLGPGALLDELGVPRYQSTKEPGPLVAHPHPRNEPRRQQLGQHPRVEPIGLRLRRGDRSHRDGVGHDHPAGVGLEDPGDGERSPRRLEDHVILRP